MLREAELAEVASAAEDDGLTRLAGYLSAEGKGQDFLGAVFDLSDFLRDCARRQPAMLDALFDQTVEQRLDALLEEIAASPRAEDVSEASLMMALRRLKLEAHFLIALADLAGEADAATTVERLSSLADACVNAAIDFLLLDAHRQGKLKLPDPENPGQRLRLGHPRHGQARRARAEFFLRHRSRRLLRSGSTRDRRSAWMRPTCSCGLTRRLVRILQDRTEHGYVFRTDLRLRPDPGSTPLAIAVEAALTYYESRGQNWERAAMIKARPVAGDLAAGEAFLKELQPYVWRKYMDYAAIADVHSIKRQIHAHKGHGEIAVKGHNVKLGRGGIREIEFFVQTQQLIAGGRFPELRGRATVPMLGQLAKRGWITAEARDALTRQYWFLRRVEHAIQMVDDEQTHTLPETDEGLERIARMLGFAGREGVLGGIPRLPAGGGAPLRGPVRDSAAAFVRRRQSGLHRRCRRSGYAADASEARFQAAERHLPRHQKLAFRPLSRDAVGRGARAPDRADAGAARSLRQDEEGRQGADALRPVPGRPAGRHPAFLAAAIQSEPVEAARHHHGRRTPPGRYHHPPPACVRRAARPGAARRTAGPHLSVGRLAAFIDSSAEYEEVLDRLRIFAAEQKFLIGVRLLAGAIDAARAGKAFSDLADLTIGAALDAVQAEFARRHGRVAGGRVAILGMGKLGSRELTAGSDVDLILLYDHDADADESDGAKPLAPSHYYARMTQRLIAAVSAPTAEGVLYELDLRLRPSGNKGPVATHVDAFKKYQRGEAWTWEHMALTRARVGRRRS